MVYISDAAGQVTSRQLLDATTTQLVVAAPAGQETIAATRIRAVSIDGDALWNGVIIGALIGSVVAIIPPGGAEQPPKWKLSAAGALLGGAVGAWRDTRRRGQTVVYRAP